MKNSQLIFDLSFYSLLLLMAFDFTIRGLLIVSGKSKALLLPFQIIYFFIKLFRGSEPVSDMKEAFQKSRMFRLYGWYSVIGGIPSIILLIILIIDATLN